MSSSVVENLLVRPILQFPKQAEIGRTYLFTIDLAPQQAFDTWPYSNDEEVVIYCLINTMPLFRSEPLGEPAIVLHRFGGTYGPARFLITASETVREGSIHITLVNGLGVPLTTFETPVIHIQKYIEHKEKLDLKIQRQTVTVSPPPVDLPQSEQPDRVAKIYISSTYADLKEYREAVYTALRSRRQEVIAMEDYSADDEHPLDKLLADVERCDIYIGIFAWRYGFVPTNNNPEQLSITELEYRHAVAKGKPCLIFLLNEEAPWPPHRVDTGIGAERIRRLRQELSIRYMISFFQTPDQLADQVSSAVTRLIEQNRTDDQARPTAYLPPASEEIPIPPLPESRPNLFGRDDEWFLPYDKLEYQCDVLLVTVTDVETEALLETVKALTSRDYQERPLHYKTYFDLGMIGGARVFAVRSEMGADTTGGSFLTVKNAIEEVKPSAVIMVGIACGVNPQKQKIGDILIARQLQPYDLQRAGTTAASAPEIMLLGEKLHCSTKLLDRLRTTRLRWKNRKKVKVHVGVMLSGQILIDNLDFRDRLLDLAKDAIGGEMEGAGLYVACQQSMVDGILVKAICDWADGMKSARKTQWQKTAAQNAAEFVIEMLASGLLANRQLDVPKLYSPLTAGKISISRLPTSGSDLFGRDRELQLLDEAWDNPNINIFNFVGWGGTGKSALVNHWLKQHMARDNYRGAERVYGWSFYSQGTSERAASADLFIDQALRWFGDTDSTAGSPWDKGERLAGLIRQTRTLLILDGLEPLQHPPGRQEGRLKDAALQALLVELAAQQSGLCVISTRERVSDLTEFENSTVVQHELEHLSPQAGAQLLRALQVKGEDDELEQAAKEYEGHALALTLLGSYLTDVLGGDIRRRYEIENLEDDVRHGRHAERVMRAYEIWLGEGVELAVLRLMGLFDRSADAASINALRAAPAIPGLTEALQGLREVAWHRAVAILRRIKLLGAASSSEPGMLTTHPLVREHFRQQLKRAYPETWRMANNRLYEHLKRAAKEFPETIAEMAPLYTAVVYGCAAGRYEEALEDIFVRRIQRGAEAFNTRKLGAFGADLYALAAFFDVPWLQPVSNLSKSAQAFVLNEAGYDLRALGRLIEAAQPLQASLASRITQGNWADAAISAINLCELYLTMGDIPQSLNLAKQSIEWADRSGDRFGQVVSRTTLAVALHQAGSLAEAESLFRETEEAQTTLQSQFSLLYSTGRFHYCDLLLEQGKYQEVYEQAIQTLEWTSKGYFLLGIALSHLSLGQAYLMQAQQETTQDVSQSVEHLERAMSGLRQAGVMDYLPRGLLARAAAYRFTGDYGRAERDLAEVLRIAARSRMELYLADYHLESARLQLAQGNRDKAREHLETARELIERMGYHRRDAMILEVEEQLA